MAQKKALTLLDDQEVGLLLRRLAFLFSRYKTAKFSCGEKNPEINSLRAMNQLIHAISKLCKKKLISDKSKLVKNHIEYYFRILHKVLKGLYWDVIRGKIDKKELEKKILSELKPMIEQITPAGHPARLVRNLKRYLVLSKDQIRQSAPRPDGSRSPQSQGAAGAADEALGRLFYGQGFRKVHDIRTKGKIFVSALEDNQSPDVKQLLELLAIRYVLSDAFNVPEKTLDAAMKALGFEEPSLLP